MKQKLLACISAAAVLLVGIATFCVAFPAAADVAPTQLTTANANLVPDVKDNLLATAELVVKDDVSNNVSSGRKYAFDGVVPGVNTTTATQAEKAAFYTSGTALRDDGTEWNKGAGWSSLIFRLGNEAEIRQFLIAGSDKDEYSSAVNNRIVVYYEIYAADTLEELFTAEALVVAFDNSQDKGICQLYTLDTALTARYVGFKLVGGQYQQARLGELGAYGTLCSDPHTALNSASDMSGAVSGKTNLLVGAAVENKPVDSYLTVAGLTTFTGEEAVLTDGQVNWTAADDVVSYTYATNSRPYYDLRGTASITGAMLVGGYARENAGLNYVRVYAADSVSALFEDASQVAFVALDGNTQGVYFPLSGITARYVGFDARAKSGNTVTLAELGVYGSYSGSVEDYTYSLIRGKTPAEILQIPARGIDNQTAVTASGAAGTGNTGSFTSSSACQSVTGIQYLTDGLNDKRTSITVKGSVLSLAYDTPWIVLTYDLGGLCEISSLQLDSYWPNGDSAYSVGGVQFYAAQSRAELFKNASLLYTSGGEKYTTDDEGNYIPDVSTQIANEESFIYTLTASQKATQVRFVSVVITRPYNYLNDGGEAIIGYNQSRLAELIVAGKMVTADAPIITDYTVASSKGDIEITIQRTDLDDRDFYLNLQGWRLTEEALSVDAVDDSGWLTADGNTVYHLELLDKSGNVVSDLGGRLVTVKLPTTAEYTQSAGQIVDGKIQRIYNAYNHTDGMIYVGSENYPVYEDGVVNNRDKAVLSSGNLNLVYLKYLDGQVIKEQDGGSYHESLFEFQDNKPKGGAAQ